MTAKPTWIEIDAEGLDREGAKLYRELKAAQKAAREAKEAFEEYVREGADVPKGKKLVFAYNFGKLSCAIVDDDGKAKASKPKQSLAEYLAAMKAAGRRV